MKLRPEYIKLNPQQRLYKLRAPIVGLTGGIATGKTTVSKILEKQGLQVISADRLVKDIYKLAETKNFIRSLCPEVFQGEEIEFPKLRELFFKDAVLKTKIEKFIYDKLPHVFASAKSEFQKSEVIIYDVPLLFEKKISELFDLTVLVYASREMQKSRLISRDGVKADMAETILKQQIDIEDKKSKADFILDNSSNEADLNLSVKKFIEKYFIS